ncbi:hypothetical protein [Archangium violaceum]|uniref:hypothetical protein n=1 Tax=Archangium violaceum TaxID=83451 RepID=UPI0036DCBC4C
MTAARHVQAGGRFRAIVEKTIQLATARREEEVRLYPPSEEVETGGVDLRRLMDELSGRTPRPAKRALMDYVACLDVADAAALVTLHYVGRDFRETEKPEAALAWQRDAMRSEHVRNTALGKFSERVLIDEYLKKGLMVAAAMGLDIEDLPRAK